MRQTCFSAFKVRWCLEVVFVILVYYEKVDASKGGSNNIVIADFGKHGSSPPPPPSPSAECNLLCKLQALALHMPSLSVHVNQHFLPSRGEFPVEFQFEYYPMTKHHHAHPFPPPYHPHIMPHHNHQLPTMVQIARLHLHPHSYAQHHTPHHAYQLDSHYTFEPDPAWLHKVGALNPYPVQMVEEHFPLHSQPQQQTIRSPEHLRNPTLDFIQISPHEVPAAPMSSPMSPFHAATGSYSSAMMDTKQMSLPVQPLSVQSFQQQSVSPVASLTVHPMAEPIAQAHLTPIQSAQNTGQPFTAVKHPQIVYDEPVSSLEDYQQRPIPVSNFANQIQKIQSIQDQLKKAREPFEPTSDAMRFAGYYSEYPAYQQDKPLTY